MHKIITEKKSNKPNAKYNSHNFLYLIHFFLLKKTSICIYTIYTLRTNFCIINLCLIIKKNKLSKIIADQSKISQNFIKFRFVKTDMSILSDFPNAQVSFMCQRIQPIEFTVQMSHKSAKC
jgi:hypothetical protein